LPRTVVIERGGRTHVSKFQGRIRKQCDAGDGYLGVTTTCDGIQKTRRVHRMVAEAFIGRQPDNREINHINGIKTDNRPENLEYVTHADNVRHSFAANLVKRVKLNRESVANIRRAKGTVRAEALAQAFGISPRSVYDIWQGKTWKHVV
jgi:hypothetical protein